MTLIVLLILAAVSLGAVFSDKGVFSRAENAGARYNEAKAREVLETVLLADGQYEKNINPEYNQDKFLDELIKSEIEGADVKGDVAIIGKYAYELDRSVPKIGRYLGKAENLVFPTVTATEPVLATDYRTTSFTVTALEEKNGINKIEIWINGEKIETLTKTYNNVKTEITENLTVNKNGKYTIKAYGDLMSSITVEVTGIVPAVEFLPNGSDEWRKEHSTRITVKETGERVTSLKYKWTTSKANPPQISEFTENCPSDNIITGKDFTGTYYLWILLTTETGKTNICGSEGFNFDNEAPKVQLTSTPTTETSFILEVLSKDEFSGIKKCELYINGETIETLDIINGKAKYTYTGTLPQSNLICRVVVVDTAGNIGEDECNSRTLLYTWKIRRIVKDAVWRLDGPIDTTEEIWGYPSNNCSYWNSKPDFDYTTGTFTPTDGMCTCKQMLGRWKILNPGSTSYLTYFYQDIGGGPSSESYKVKKYTVVKVSNAVWGDWEEIQSTDANAYPKSGVESKKEYSYIGLK